MEAKLYNKNISITASVSKIKAITQLFKIFKKSTNLLVRRIGSLLWSTGMSLGTSDPAEKRKRDWKYAYSRPESPASRHGPALENLRSKDLNENTHVFKLNMDDRNSNGLKNCFH